jgi:glycosyltransferase involved in cell wall biosynthesis
MFIAIDARMLLPQMTGVGRYLSGLAQGLASILYEDNDAEQVEFWLQAGLPPEHSIWQLQSPRMKMCAIAARHMSLRQQWVVPIEARRRKPALYHCPHFDLPVLTPGKIVVTIHDLKYLAHPQFFARKAHARRLLMRLMMGAAVQRARLVITDAEFTRRDLAQRLNVPMNKTRSIPLGVEARYQPQIPSQAIQEMRQRYHLAENYLLFIGERRPHKNIPGLLRAFAIFQKMSQQPYQLVIAGKKYAQYDEPERLAQALGLEGSVRFLDYVADEHLPALYGDAKVLALLSLYEGFGLPILEAMACGTPVVAANRTALPEVCGQAGLLVEPQEAQQAALALLEAAEGEPRQEWIEKGLAWAKRFTWEACARQTLEVYREALRA